MVYWGRIVLMRPKESIYTDWKSIYVQQQIKFKMVNWFFNLVSPTGEIHNSIYKFT